MGNIVPLREEPDNMVPLQTRALDDLAFIRQTMARSGPFTAVPGWGMVAMGVIALGGAHFASQRATLDGWILTWLAVACLGCTVGIVGALIKAHRQGIPLWKGPGRRFVLSFLPAIAAGCLLTEFLYEWGHYAFMPMVWLMLYGVGVTSAGVYSVKAIPLMGIVFMLYSIAVFNAPLFLAGTLIEPYVDINHALALGFGGFHIVFGLIIALRYGG